MKNSANELQVVHLEEQGKVFLPTENLTIALIWKLLWNWGINDNKSWASFIQLEVPGKIILSPMKKLDELIRRTTGCSKNWPGCVRRLETEPMCWRSQLLHLFKCTTVPSTGKRSSRELRKKTWLYWRDWQQWNQHLEWSVLNNCGTISAMWAMEVLHQLQEKKVLFPGSVVCLESLQERTLHQAQWDRRKNPCQFHLLWCHRDLSPLMFLLLV